MYGRHCHVGTVAQPVANPEHDAVADVASDGGGWCDEDLPFKGRAVLASMARGECPWENGNYAKVRLVVSTLPLATVAFAHSSEPTTQTSVASATKSRHIPITNAWPRKAMKTA
jgi:hypothetical protein